MIVHLRSNVDCRLIGLLVLVLFVASSCNLLNPGSPTYPANQCVETSVEWTSEVTRSTWICTAPLISVWDALLSVMQERNEVITFTSLETREARLITDAQTVTKERLKEIIQEGSREVRRGGWYRLDFEIKETAKSTTRIQLTLLIVESDPLRQNVYGGIPRRSNGTLESEIFSALVQELPA